MLKSGSRHLRQFNQKIREDGLNSALRSGFRRGILIPYTDIKRRAIEWQRYARYRSVYGPSTPKPNKTIFLSPESISLTLPRRVVPESSHPFKNWIEQRSRYGIIDGNWDRHAIPITEASHFQGVYERYVEGKQWNNTSEYINHKERGWSEDKIHRHFDEVDQLFNSMTKKGYDPEYPVSVHITRDGEFIRREGFHRIAIARILDISRIPAKVKLRHKRWQKCRSSIYDSGLSNGQEGLKNHPDLREVLGEVDQLIEQ